VLERLILRRPLAILDCETTSRDAASAKVVELSVLIVRPDGSVHHRTRRVDPEIPIPAAATRVHSITDEDVAGEPSFRLLAGGLLKLLAGCDLAGFNLRKYDLRVLDAEFRRAGRSLPLAGRRVVDAMEIYHAKEPRDLAAAVRFYLGRDHEGAHGAAADALATAEVLDAQLERYCDLPRDLEGLAAALQPVGSIDLGGCFRKDAEGEVVLNFGKHRDRALAELARAHPDYLRWMLAGGFLGDAKEIAADALWPRTSPLTSRTSV
jgi:DNA polymerase-3 subunit epsilon